MRRRNDKTFLKEKKMKSGFFLLAVLISVLISTTSRTGGMRKAPKRSLAA